MDADLFVDQLVIHSGLSEHAAYCCYSQRGYNMMLLSPAHVTHPMQAGPLMASHVLPFTRRRPWACTSWYKDGVRALRTLPYE